MADDKHQYLSAADERVGNRRENAATDNHHHRHRNEFTTATTTKAFGEVGAYGLVEYRHSNTI